MTERLRGGYLYQERLQCRLLRQGNAVAVLEGPVDFMTEVSLAALWNGLELEVTG